MSKFENDVKLFMIFDILGDTVRTGPQLWYIERKRLEDVKNHILDLLLIEKVLYKYMPDFLDKDKIFNYTVCHDLPEAITGDITKFEGVSGEEINHVTRLAIDYLIEKFNGVMDLKTYLNNFEEKADIEAKVVTMIDKVHSASTFIKYQSEQDIDMDDSRILPVLRNHPFVVQKISEGKDLADIFYEFHMMAVNISDEECEKYGVSRADADRIVSAIRGFAEEMYNQKLNGTLLEGKDNFPREAMKYNRAYLEEKKEQLIVEY